MTTIAQTLSDMAIMGEKSDVEYYADALENAGFTEEEAKKMALKEFFLNNPVKNSTTAFVSNAIVSGANSAASGYRKPAEIYEDADETAKLTEGKDSGRINEDTDMLFKELENGGVKFSKEDTLFITRDKTGQIVWLENGNHGAGLNHILDGDGKTKGHADDFQRALGISRADVPAYLEKVITNGEIIANKLKPIGEKFGYERIYYYEGKYHVVTGIGTNGFVVSAYPVHIRK